MIKYLLGLSLLFSSFTIFADEIVIPNARIVIEKEADLFLVGKKVFFLEDTNGNLTIEDILKPENQKAFALNDKDIFVRRPTASYFWLKLNIENQTGKDIWLELGSTFLWYIDYFTESNGKYVLTTETGSLRAEKNKAYPSNLFLLPLGNFANERTIYVRVQSLRPIEIPIQIGNLLSLTENKHRSDLLMAGFLGVMLIIFFYNLFLLWVNKEKLYIWYIGYIIFATLAVAHNHNYPFSSYFFNDTISRFLHSHPFVFLNIPIIFAGFFASRFLGLDQRKILKSIVLFFNIYILIGLSFCDAFGFVPHQILVHIQQPTMILGLFFLLGISSYLWLKEGNRNARFYYMAWIWIILSIFSYYLTVNGFVDYNYFTRHAVLFGISIQSLFFSLALADKINILRTEKESAQTALVFFTKNQNQVLDATVKKRSIELNRKSEMLEVTNQIARIGTWEIDMVLNSWYWSNVTREIHEVDYKYQPNLGEGLQFYKEGENRNKIRNAMGQILQEGTPFDLELILITPEGKEKWVRAIGHAETENGKPKRIFGIFQDIGKQKQSETALAKMNTFNLAVIDSISEHIAVLDANGTIVAVNAAWRKFAMENGSDKDFIGSNYIDLCQPAGSFGHGNEPDEARQGILAVMNEQLLEFTLEYPCHSPTEERWFLMYVRPISYPDKGVVIAHLNISGRKKTEIALQEKEQVIKKIGDNLPNGTIYQLVSKPDESVHFSYISAGADRIFGISPSEIMEDSKSLFSRVHPEDIERLLAARKESKKNLTVFEQIQRQYTVHGELKWIQFRSMPRRLEDGSVVWDGIASDVTELMKTRKELEQAKFQAEAANRAKSEFLANMSHEIRTPLNGIIGFTDLLVKSNLDESQTLHMKTVSRSAFLLLDLINDILDFSKIEAGKLELNIGRFNLTELTSQSLDIMQVQLKQKPIEIISNLPPNQDIFIWGDEQRIRQILINLLGNAIKFTKKGKIEIKIEVLNPNNGNEKAKIYFSVTDTGIGISKANQQKIFQAFSQEDSTTSRKYGGTGLGLTISNKLLSLMNSKLEVESEVGIGSRFHFILSAKAELAPKITVESPAKNALKEKSEKTTLAISKSLATCTVLLAEDNEINTLLAQTLITRLLPSSKIVSAVNGKYVIEEFQKEKPDIIFMDVQMPELNGYEATREIRKIEIGSRTPIIALSAGNSSEEIEECLNSGMDDFISKPILPGDMERILEKWLVLHKPHEFNVNLSKDEEYLSHFAIEKLKERLGESDDTLLKTVISIARKNIDQFLKEIKNHFNTKNLKGLKESAHKCKGSALTMSFGKLALLAANLEKVKVFDEATISKSIDEFEIEIQYLISILAPDKEI